MSTPAIASPEPPAIVSPAPLEDLELRVWSGFMRAHACLVKALDSALESRHGLALSSYQVLRQLGGAERGRMRMCDLADTIMLSRSGLTRLVDRLEREGLLQRVSCSHDARGAYAVVTEAGRERLRSARETHRATVRAEFLDHFSPHELQDLASYWERLHPGCGC